MPLSWSPNTLVKGTLEASEQSPWGKDDGKDAKIEEVGSLLRSDPPGIQHPKPAGLRQPPLRLQKQLRNC